MRQGTPDVDLGGPVRSTVVANAAATSVPAVRAFSRFSPSAADAETADSRLQSALHAVQHAPTVATHLVAAEEYRRLGILDKAFDHLQHGAVLDQHNAGINDGLARIWRDWGLPGVGLSSAYRAVYSAPRAAVPRHTLGTLLYALGQRTEAERAFREAVSLDPLAWYSWQNLCSLAMADGRTHDAIALCQRATAAHRESLKVAGHERN